MIRDDPSIIKPILESLKKSFEGQKTKDIAFRKQQLGNLIKGLNELNSEIENALSKDLGYSPFTAFVLSQTITISEVEYARKNLEKWVKPRECDTPILIGPGKSYVYPEPFGISLVIGPWNFPFYNCIPQCASAIAAGNCVVLKPSELSPHSSNVIKKLFDNYLDKDCYRVVEGGVEVSKQLIKEEFDLIIFTGSTEKGKLIAKAAAENLTPCILELGGKSPTIVDEGANLENAALRITQGKFGNSGQACVAPDYLFVHKNVKKDFLERMIRTIKEFYGDVMKSPDWVRIINDGHMNRLEKLLTTHKGKILCGGKIDKDLRKIEPTLVENPDMDSDLMKDEIFGPILPIFEFSNFDEVINEINKRPKPLAMYYFGPVFSSHKQRLINETSSGAICFNETNLHAINPQLPFGGVQNSGTGSLHGKWGFDNCCHMKAVLDKLPINSFPVTSRYPPYSPGKQKLFSLLLKTHDIYQKKVLYIMAFLLILPLVIITFEKLSTTHFVSYFWKIFVSIFHMLQGGN